MTIDLSFEIYNDRGDQVTVALSYYDTEAVRIFTSDPLTLTLVFYDITLVRTGGDSYVGKDILFAISDTLARFLGENPDAVLCFYCDSLTDVRKHHSGMTPQQYRSRLFSRMFERWMSTHGQMDFMNHVVAIEDDTDPRNWQYAHFICRREHRHAVMALDEMLMEK